MKFGERDRVAYIPMHAGGDKTHPDVEYGTVSSVNDKYVFVRFDKQVEKLGWSGATSQACDPEDLTLIIKWHPENFF